MQPVEVQRIVNAYGDVLAEKVATGVARDIDALPFSKSEIKTALLVALDLNLDPIFREHLRNAYVSLADFQELSDAEVQSLQRWNSAMAGAPTLDHDKLRNEAVSLSAIGQDVIGVQTRIAADAEALALELHAAGH